MCIATVLVIDAYIFAIFTVCIYQDAYLIYQKPAWMSELVQPSCCSEACGTGTKDENSDLQCASPLDIRTGRRKRACRCRRAFC